MQTMKGAVENTLRAKKRPLIVTAGLVAVGAVIMYVFYIKVLKPRLNSDYTANKEFINKGEDDNTVDLLYIFIQPGAHTVRRLNLSGTDLEANGKKKGSRVTS